jgi:hypothetical protein
LTNGGPFDGASSNTVRPTCIQQNTTWYVPAECPNAHGALTTSMATRIKADVIDYDTIASPPGTNRRTISLIFADWNMSSPALLSTILPDYCGLEPRLGVPHRNSQESGLL